jgi:hypothetical protein
MVRMKLANIFLILSSVLASLILAEIMLGLLVRPSNTSSGEIFGRQLPPLRVIPPNLVADIETKVSRDGDDWREAHLVNGKELTFGDLNGIMREDEYLGHAPLENAVSANGWWQSNDLGARSRKAFLDERPDPAERAIFFGDSYTHGSRVPQEETFVYFLDKRVPDVQAVNFGADGYGIGQAFLRYQTLKDKLAHDRVVLVLVPAADLWREINVIRYIARGWKSYKVNPRFIFEQNELRLVPSPYKNLQELLNDNRTGMRDSLRQHLLRYDAFYFSARYESTPIFDFSVGFRLIKRAWAQQQYKVLMKNLARTDSEAMILAREIVKAMERMVNAFGARFTFVILPGPGDTVRYLNDSNYRNEWRAMAHFLCAGVNDSHDLMQDFKSTSPDRFDLGYDGSHFGPSANSLIADILARRAFR